MTENSDLSRRGMPAAMEQRGWYYGWVVLLAGTVGVIMSVPGQTMGVSVYTEPLVESLHVTRVELSLAYMFGTLASAMLLPFVGRLLDSLGARFVGVLASVGLAIWLLLLSVSPALTHWLTAVAHLPPAWAGSVVAFVGFLGIRHFGQGELTIASRTMMGRWFERRRGLVLGVSGFFVAFGFGVAPLVLHRLIVRFTWQRSLWVLAAASGVMAAFAWLTFRQSPEACGVVIDGGPVMSAETAKALADEPSYTVEQARRTLVFWAFNFGMMAQAMLVTAVIFNMERIAQLNHMTAAKAYSVFLPIAVVSTVAELGSGAVSDRIPMKYLLTFMQAGICCGLVGVHFYSSEIGFGLAALGFGISNGLFSLLSGAAWPKLLGASTLARLRAST